MTPLFVLFVCLIGFFNWLFSVPFWAGLPTLAIAFGVALHEEFTQRKEGN
jgi:hypothetical protein